MAIGLNFGKNDYSVEKKVKSDIEKVNAFGENLKQEVDTSINKVNDDLKSLVPEEQVEAFYDAKANITGNIENTINGIDETVELMNNTAKKVVSDVGKAIFDVIDDEQEIVVDATENNENLDSSSQTSESKEESSASAQASESKVVSSGNNGTVSGYDYKESSSKGFTVTTDNKTYNISDADYDFMCACVMAEGGSDPNEALAVASVILNRCDNGNWGGTTPRSVLTAKSQFEVYSKGYYQKYMNGNVPDTVKMAVTDALNGTRNNDYQSFRSNGTTSYSSNMITSSGNRYK